MTTTLTLPEAAKLLRVHKTTLRLRAAAGDVPGAKVGRAWTFIESDLLAHLRSQYQCPSTIMSYAESTARAKDIRYGKSVN